MIFNLFAIPIVLVVVLLGQGLFWLAPGIFGGPYEELTYSVLAIVVGGLGEVIGLKGRLFFLPVWLIGGATLTYQLWTLFGLMGLAVGGGLLALLVVAFAVSVVFALRSVTKDMPKKLEEARDKIAKGEFEGAREALADAWMLPMSALDPARGEHLRAVLVVVQEHGAQLGLSPAAGPLVHTSRALIERLLVNRQPYGFFSDECTVLGEVEPMLREGAKWAPKDTLNENLAKLGAPPP